MYVELEKVMRFEAAHWLPTFPIDHKCHRLHGHSYKITVTVGGFLEDNDKSGYLIDYADVGQAIDPVYKTLDHRCLNDIQGLENPTTENLAKWIWDKVYKSIPKYLKCIRVDETCTTACEYRGN